MERQDETTEVGGGSGKFADVCESVLQIPNPMHFQTLNVPDGDAQGGEAGAGAAQGVDKAGGARCARARGLPALAGRRPRLREDCDGCAQIRPIGVRIVAQTRLMRRSLNGDAKNQYKIDF